MPDNPEPELVTLRDGNQVPAPILTVVMAALRSMVASMDSVRIMALYDLWKSSNDPTYVIGNRNAEVLMKAQLVEDISRGVPQINHMVRSIVKGAIEFNGLNLDFHSPVASD
ncbi:MAG TPA: hypothetical protein VLF67_01195 [Candidatus Saccharimonas sp.]|nr:hypothetical protein [Candidatus Saccharimonas sp.]